MIVFYIYISLKIIRFAGHVSIRASCPTNATPTSERGTTSWNQHRFTGLQYPSSRRQKCTSNGREPRKYLGSNQHVRLLTRKDDPRGAAPARQVRRSRDGRVPEPSILPWISPLRRGLPSQHRLSQRIRQLSPVFSPHVSGTIAP